MNDLRSKVIKEFDIARGEVYKALKDKYNDSDQEISFGQLKKNLLRQIEEGDFRDYQEILEELGIENKPAPIISVPAQTPISVVDSSGGFTDAIKILDLANKIGTDRAIILLQDYLINQK